MKKFRNTTILGLLVMMMLVFNGCINVIEEITFNKNGSGTYNLTFDMSGMMSFLKDMDLDKMMDDGGDDGEEPANDGEDIVKEEKEPVVKDSIINFGDIIAERGDDFIENPEFWKKVKMRMNMNEPKGILEMTMFFDFKDSKEIAYFHENLDKLSGDDNPLGNDQMGGLLNMMSGSMGQGGDKISFKKRSFSRKAAKADKKKEEKLSDEEQQQMDMMKMMMASATWKTVYNFPRKVKSVSNQNAKISDSGKTVTTVFSLMEMMEGNINMDDKIKLKRR